MLFPPSCAAHSYGILDVFFHHIADTHVAHHLFSYMPHYHAQEATQAIRKVRQTLFQVVALSRCDAWQD